MNLLDLFARISLDKREYDEGLNEAERQADSFGGKLVSGLGNGMKVLGAAAATATGAAVTGVTALTTASVNAYGNYEQLAGGVEKLFGESSDVIMQYAGQAYETAGMSANQYMETVTSFSASLINGLEGDTEQAAEVADMAVRDMADNANTFGTSIESIQAAYSGFARGNFTMLDNLKLGYAGSAEGMLQLVNDSGILEEAVTSLDDVSFDQMIEAIHAVQTDLNITGTTANEAADTIQGSLGTLQGAWTNLITGLGDSSADLGGLIDKVVSAATNVVKNIRPIAVQAIQGISQAVKALAPVIATELPAVIQDIAPDLIDAVTTLVDTLISVLPSLVETLLPVVIEVALTILDSLTTIFSDPNGSVGNIIISIGNGIIAALPKLITAAVAIIQALVDGISKSLPTLLPAAAQAVMTIVTELIRLAPSLLESGLELIMSLTEGLINSIPVIIEQLPQLIDAILNFLVESLPLIIDAGIQLFTALVDALPEIITTIVKVLPEIISSIIDTLVQLTPLIVEAGVQLFIALITNLPQIILTIVGAIPQIILAIVGGILSADSISQIIVAGAELLVNIVTGIPDILSDIGSGLGKIWTKISEVVRGWWDDLKEIGKYIIEGLKDGIEEKADDVAEVLKHPVRSVKNFLGISSPSKLMREWGRYIDEGLALGIEDEADKPTDSMIGVADEVAGTMDGLGGDISVGVNYRAGNQSLGDMLTATVRTMTDNMQFVLPVYIGDEKLDELVVNSNQRYDYVGGGRG